MDEDDLIRTVGRVESKVDILLDRTKDQEGRIQDLERSRNWMRGVLASLGVAWAALLKFSIGGR